MASAGYVALIERDWTIPQGSDTVNAFLYGTKITKSDPMVYPALLTDGWIARAQIRPAVGKEVWVEFLSSSTMGARIELRDDGSIYVVLPASVTEDPAWNSRSRGVYDLELVSPTGGVTRVAKGKITVSKDVTRSVV